MTTLTADVTKRIQYNRDTRDYDCFVTIDGDEAYIGSARNYSEGETKCNAYAYDHYSDNHTPEVCAELVLADEPIADSAPAAPKPPVAVSQGEGWHVEYRHATNDYAAVIETDDVGCIGYRSLPLAAQALVQKYQDFVTKRTADLPSIFRPVPAPELLAEVDALLGSDPPAEPAPEDDDSPGGPYAHCPGAFVPCGLPTPPNQGFCGFCQQKIDRMVAQIAPEPWSVVRARIQGNVMARITPIEPARCTCGAVATQALPAGRGLVQPACDVCADGLLLAPIVRRVLERVA